MNVYAIFVLPYLIYRYQPKLKDEYRLKFCDDEIGFQTDNIDSRLQWSLYNAWLRDDEFYLLYSGKRDISVIPRRAFQGDKDQRFAELLQKHIGPAKS